MMGDWKGPVATIQADCQGCLRACRRNADCLATVFNGMDVPHNATTCPSTTHTHHGRLASPFPHRHGTAHCPRRASCHD